MSKLSEAFDLLNKDVQELNKEHWVETGCDADKINALFGCLQHKLTELTNRIEEYEEKMLKLELKHID